LHRAFVVAANRFFRESLASLLSAERDLTVVGASEFSLLSLQEISQLTPDIVVLSPDWSDTEFHATRAIRQACPQVKILMITMKDDQDVFLRAVRAGAVGYLLKDASAKQIVGAVRRLGRGSVLCPPQLEHVLFGFVAHGPLSLASELTVREEQLASLVAQGLTNKEIASRLNLSEQTVKNHVHNILRKTGSKSRGTITHFLQGKSPAGSSAGRLAPAAAS
jgi:DNA-binding NarL/FixJ family response regulator